MKVRKMAKSKDGFSSKLRQFNKTIHEGNQLTYVVQFDDFIRRVEKSTGVNTIVLEEIKLKDSDKTFLLCTDGRKLFLEEMK